MVSASTQLQDRGNGRKIHRKAGVGGWGEGGLKGQRRVEENTTFQPAQSLALQMLAIGSVNGAQAFRAEFEYCLRAACQADCTAQCGRRAGIQCSAMVKTHSGRVWDPRLFSDHSRMSK